MVKQACSISHVTILWTCVCCVSFQWDSLVSDSLTDRKSLLPRIRWHSFQKVEQVFAATLSSCISFPKLGHKFSMLLYHGYILTVPCKGTAPTVISMLCLTQMFTWINCAIKGWWGIQWLCKCQSSGVGKPTCCRHQDLLLLLVVFVRILEEIFLYIVDVGNAPNI